jgi:hypothetical protein
VLRQTPGSHPGTPSGTLHPASLPLPEVAMDTVLVSVAREPGLYRESAAQPTHYQDPPPLLPMPPPEDPLENPESPDEEPPPDELPNDVLLEMLGGT